MGKPLVPKKPSRAKLIKLYIKESKSIRAVASELGLHPDTVHYWLKKYGVETRSKTRKSQLLSVSLDEIEKKISKIGIRGYARELGLSDGTIRHHLKIRRNKSSE